MKVKMFLFMSTAVTLLMIMSFNTSSPTEVPTDEALPSTSSFNFTENDPPCLRMYEAIEKYATMYNIPKRYAYGVANVETGYRGPFHWKYNQAQTSCVGALGPMQIMPGTAQMMWPNKDISRTRLKTDIEYNVHTSMKLLRKLYNKYEDWKVVFGCYNTGRPLVNGYAIEVYNFKPLF